MSSASSLGARVGTLGQSCVRDSSLAQYAMSSSLTTPKGAAPRAHSSIATSASMSSAMESTGTTNLTTASMESHLVSATCETRGHDALDSALRIASALDRSWARTAGAPPLETGRDAFESHPRLDSYVETALAEDPHVPADIKCLHSATNSMAPLVVIRRAPLERSVLSPPAHSQHALRRIALLTRSSGGGFCSPANTSMRVVIARIEDTHAFSSVWP
jgi:hypothetical protein